MLKIYDKNKAPLKGLTRYKDLCIEGFLELDDRKLSFSVPATEAAGLENECYIRTKEDEYVVKELQREGAYIKVSAALNLEDLEGNAFRAFKSTEQPIDKALALAFAGSGWLVENHGVAKKRTLSMSYTDAVKILKQAVKTYRVEIRIDSLAQTVHIYPSVGSDRGVYFSSQLNLKKLNIQSTSYDFYTRIEPYGKDGMTIEEVNSGSAYLEDNSYSSKVKTYIWKDERYTVPESLMEDARYKLQDLCRPYTAYTADVMDLASVSKKYGILDYGLGDTVTLLDAASGTREKQRIVSMKQYPDEPSRNTCQIANRRLSFEGMAQKYADASDTVQNITNDNGEIDGDTVDGILTKQIKDWDDALKDGIELSGKFHDLEVKYLEVTGKLVAVEAEIGTLKTTYLTATQADIKYLKVEDAKIKYATIEEAQIANAKVTNLEAVTGQITTLLSGNAGIGELQNIHLTSRNAVIESALITDAVIKNLTVADLLAGDISTNRFRIISEDGGILISGATQQWKDKDGVIRMQAGRDAQDNFTFSLFGADGRGVLIDVSGIHADAVPDGLIVDAMVSGEAHIAGSKLDINSVVEEINGSTTTINATHIKLDDTGQSLSVAFTKMVTEVTEAKLSVDEAVGQIGSWDVRITAAETTANLVNGRFSLLFTESQMTELQGSGQTMYTRMHDTETTLDGYSSQISSMRTDVNGVVSDMNALQRDVTSFKSTVSSSVSTMDGKITSAESTITQLSGEIDMKVDKNGLIGQINNSGESIKISANRIDLTGNGVINLINNFGTTTLNASRINLNGLVTANGSFKINTSGYMECIGGTIGGFDISSTYLKSGNTTNGFYLFTQDYNNSSAIRIYSGGTATLGINYDGYVVASNAKISGQLLTKSGSFYCNILNGQVQGGYGSTQYGRIEFTQQIDNINTGVTWNGVNIFGKNFVWLHAPYLYVSRSASASASGTQARTATITISGTRLEFMNGILVG